MEKKQKRQSTRAQKRRWDSENQSFSPVPAEAIRWILKNEKLTSEERAVLRKQLASAEKAKK